MWLIVFSHYRHGYLYYSFVLNPNGRLPFASRHWLMRRVFSGRPTLRFSYLGFPFLVVFPFLQSAAFLRFYFPKAFFKMRFKHLQYFVLFFFFFFFLKRKSLRLTPSPPS